MTENGTTTATNYTMSGKRLVHLSNGAHELHFFYDAQGRPAKVDYNGTVYTYVHNLQGDVAGILDSTGALVVEYKYDAWGRATYASDQLPISNWLGVLNPFRYRGYIYDSETGMYYLRSRYYNPDQARYISPDIYYSTGQGICGTNRYCYCANSPIVALDADGDMFLLLTAVVCAAVGAVIGGIKAAQEGENIGKGVLVGLGVGGAIGLGIGAIGGIVLAGSATASTLAVVTGARTIACLVASGSIASGSAFVAQNVRNFMSGITVLGRYPRYIEVARALRSRLFSYPTEMWDKLSPVQQYRLNMEFLRYAVSKGQDIILSANAYSAPENSAFASEIRFLLANGYRIVNEGWKMVR